MGSRIAATTEDVGRYVRGLEGLKLSSTSSAGNMRTFQIGEPALAAGESWAAAHNGITIGMTQYGQAIQNGTMTPEAASVAFANSASGTAQVFSNAPLTNFGNIWFNYELPALGDNPNVTNIVFNPVPRP